MAVILDIVEGTTARQGPFTLKVDGSPLNLTGLTVTLQLRGSGQASYVDTAGDTEVDADQVTNTGQVYWDPDAADLEYTRSEYSMRFKVVDGAAKVAFWPNAEPEKIRVQRDVDLGHPARHQPQLRPVSRSYAATYRSRVPRMTSSGNSGAGGSLVQPVAATKSRTNCLSKLAGEEPGS